MTDAPRVRLRASGSSRAAELAAAGRWRELPATLSVHELNEVAHTLNGYEIAIEHLDRDAFEVAHSLVERHRVSRMWGGTTVELLAAFFADVRGWRGLYYDVPREGDKDHERALAIYGALLRRLEQFPGEVAFVRRPEDEDSPDPSPCNIRTSKSHPLRIGWLEAPAPWRIGITIAPGKYGRAREGFIWARSLTADLGSIVEARAHTLVCLLESREMSRLGIPDLLEAARHRGLVPVHSPIVDVSVPVREAAESVVASLIAQPEKAVVIHCNGGLGRSGVIAGCLLRALGVEPEETLTRLRAARGPECPQTEEQRQFVRRFLR